MAEIPLKDRDEAEGKEATPKTDRQLQKLREAYRRAWGKDMPDSLERAITRARDERGTR